MRGNASKFASKQESQASAETRLVMFLTNVRPVMRAGVTVESLMATHNVSEKVAKYRLALAQQRWAAE